MRHMTSSACARRVTLAVTIGAATVVGGAALAARGPAAVTLVDSISNVEVVLTPAVERGGAVCVEMTVDDAVHDGCIGPGLLSTGTAFMSVQNDIGDSWFTVGVVPDDVAEVDVMSQRLVPAGNMWVIESETAPEVITARSLEGERTLDIGQN